MTEKNLKPLLAVSAIFALALGNNAFGADKVKVCFLLKTMFAFC